MILQFLQGPICANRAIKSSSETDGSRLPTYLLYWAKIVTIDNSFLKIEITYRVRAFVFSSDEESIIY